MRFDLRPLARGLHWPAGLLLSLAASAAFACSTVALGLANRPVVAYSFDFAPTGAGFIFVNPAGATRSSIMDGAPAQWPARFGSVTFNQLGPGMPAAGMNTAGLVVTLMWNDDATYGGDAAAPVVNELEFIQHLLDTSGSVDQALAALNDVRIQGLVPIHFFLADGTGATAAVTPSANGLSVHTGDDMSIPALTNTSYADLLQRIEAYEGFGGDQPLPSAAEPTSLNRFIAAAAASRRIGPHTATSDQAFAVLEEVANPTTRWQIVFDPTNQQIAFHVAGHSDTHLVELANIDFRCREHALSADLTRLSGQDLQTALAPTDPSQVRDVSREVLASFRATAHLGPDIADSLTTALLAAATCDTRG